MLLRKFIKMSKISVLDDENIKIVWSAPELSNIDFLSTANDCPVGTEDGKCMGTPEDEDGSEATEDS